MTKKTVWEEVDTMYVDYELASNIIETLQRHINTYGSENVRVDKCSYGYGDGEYIGIMIQREETDSEEEKRLAIDARYAFESEKREREQFESLKKKFGDK